MSLSDVVPPADTDSVSGSWGYSVSRGGIEPAVTSVAAELIDAVRVATRLLGWLAAEAVGMAGRGPPAAPPPEVRALRGGPEWALPPGEVGTEHRWKHCQHGQHDSDWTRLRVYYR